MSTTKPKWTPGPWRVRDDGEVFWLESGAAGVDRVVADPPVAEQVEEEDRANFQLLAAAPDMAAALRALVAGVRTFEAIAAGRAALQKAGVLT